MYLLFTNSTLPSLNSFLDFRFALRLAGSTYICFLQSDVLLGTEAIVWRCLTIYPTLPIFSITGFPSFGWSPNVRRWRSKSRATSRAIASIYFICPVFAKLYIESIQTFLQKNLLIGSWMNIKQFCFINISIISILRSFFFLIITI